MLERGGGRRHPYVGMTLKDRNTKGVGKMDVLVRYRFIQEGFLES